MAADTGGAGPGSSNPGRSKQPKGGPMITVPVSRRTSRLLSPVDVLVWVALGCFGVVKGTPAQAQTASVIIPDQYVVVLHDDADARAHADAAVREHGVQLLHIYEHAFKGFAFRG